MATNEELRSAVTLSERLGRGPLQQFAHAVERAIDSELAGTRVELDPARVLRIVGSPVDGQCTLPRYWSVHGFPMRRLPEYASTARGCCRQGQGEAHG